MLRCCIISEVLSHAFKTITLGIVYLLLNYHYKRRGYVSVTYEETIKFCMLIRCFMYVGVKKVRYRVLLKGW